MRRHVLLLALVAIAAACGPAATASVPPAASLAPAQPASTPSPTPAATPTRAPSPPPGTTGWPLVFDLAMSGTYWSSPPFRIPFSISLEEPGWFSGHLHAEFIDLQRYDGMTQHTFPNRILGFGDPETIRGDRPVPVAELTPGAAIDLLVARSSLATANRAAVELFGLAGERLDLHSATNNNPLFGGEAGDFGLGPQLDVRLALLQREDRLLVVAVLAARGDLDGAWDQALPILATVELET